MVRVSLLKVVKAEGLKVALIQRSRSNIIGIRVLSDPKTAHPEPILTTPVPLGHGAMGLS